MRRLFLTFIFFLMAINVDAQISRFVPGLVGATGPSTDTTWLHNNLTNVKAGVFNTLDYGAKADSATDCAAAIQAAADVSIGKTLKIPPGAYILNSGVTFCCNVEATGARFYTNDTTITLITVKDSTTAYSGLTLNLPSVCLRVHTSGVWPTNANCVGIKMVNATAWKVFLSKVEHFRVGVLLANVGTNKGCQYSSFYGGELWSNKINTMLSPGVPSGSVNENTFYGTRMSYYSEDGTGVAGVREVLIDSSTAHQLNNNRFVNCSFEGNCPQYDVECYGTNNQFLWCRWEITTPKVKYTQLGSTEPKNNAIIGGYGSKDIVFTEPAGVTNYWQNDNAIIFRGSSGFIGSASSDANGVFTAVSNADTLNSPFSTNYGWRAGQDYMQTKAKADAYPRLQIDNATGKIRFGGGSADITSSGAYIDYGVAGTVEMVGKYGINTYDPARTLHVVGDVRVTALPFYANKSAARSGGLTHGDFYMTVTAATDTVVAIIP